MPTGQEAFVKGLPLLREACEAAGRDVDSVRVTVVDRHVDPERADFYADHGVERVIVSKVMTPALAENLDALLDGVAASVAKFLDP
jgi:hypothetical protein